MPNLLYHGLDELSVEQGFTLPSTRTIRHCPYPALDALRSHGILANRSHYPNHGGAHKILLPDGSTLTFVQRGKGAGLIFVYVAQPALHREPALAYTRALEALRVAVHACHDPGSAAALKPPVLRSVGLCADVQGFRFTQGTASRIVNKTGIRKTPMMDSTGSFITSINCPDFIRWYDKDEEIARRPSKAYIREYHRRGGWREGAGPAVRFEATFDRAHLRRLAERNSGRMPSLDELWQYALDRFSLRRKPRNSMDGRKSRWPEAPLWRLLRTVSGWEPWADRPEPPKPVDKTREQDFERTMLMLMGVSVRAALLDGRQGQPIHDAVSEMVDRFLRARPDKATEYAERLADDDDDAPPVLLPGHDPLRPRGPFNPDALAEAFAALGTGKDRPERLN